MKKLLAGAACTLLLIAGCSSGSSNGSDHEQTLGAYFNAFGTQEASKMEPMLTAAAKGSPAYIYAEHQINAALAQESANETQEPDTITVDGDTVTQTLKLPEDATEEQKKEATNTYTDFQFSADGLLETWTSEPGGALAPRIQAQTGKATSGQVSVDLKTAYETNGGSLMVTFEVNNKSNKKANVSITGYVNPDGRQVKVATTPYSFDPAAGSFATGSGLITNGKRGGKLIVQFDYQNESSIKVS